MSYAGDLTPQEAWDLLAENPRAVLIDVRTTAEWTYVGVPDLSSIGKETRFIPWVEFPQMTTNDIFVEQVCACVPDQDTPILFLCRSGVRSVATAQAMAANGYSSCFNVLQGFEGDMNDERQRRTVGGWCKSCLPWVQS